MTRDAPSSKPEAPPVRRSTASLARRYAAIAYDGLLLGAIVLLVGFLTMPLVSPAARTAHALEVPSLPARTLSACALFGAAGLYFTWSWTGGRRTLPMKTWRLALETVDGRKLEARTAVIRYFAAWIGPLLSLAAYEALRPSGFAAQAAWLVAINYLWPLVDRDRQFLHDRIAGTRIVNA